MDAFASSTSALKNNVNWAKINALPYVLDAAVPTSVLFGQSKINWVGNRKCRDPGAFFGPTGLDAIVFAYRKKSGNPATDNRFVLFMRSSATAPLSSVVHTIGVTGNTTGLLVGACNRLYVTPFLFQSFRTDGSGEARWTASGAYQPQAVGVRVWFQAGWANSKTKGLSLTNAVWLALPQQPPATLERRALWAFSASATTSALAPSNTPHDLPVIRYGQ